jgi:hypothetical protein
MDTHLNVWGLSLCGAVSCGTSERSVIDYNTDRPHTGLRLRNVSGV